MEIEELLKDTDVHALEGRDQVLVLKTNIVTEEHVAQVTPWLSADSRITRWNIDLDDIDHVLRIEAHQVTASEIIRYITSAGFSCEELED